VEVGEMGGRSITIMTTTTMTKEEVEIQGTAMGRPKERQGRGARMRMRSSRSILLRKQMAARRDIVIWRFCKHGEGVLKDPSSGALIPLI